MNILITGSNGFIGSNLVKKLVNKDNKIYSLVLKGTNEEFLKDIDTEIIYGDVTKPETLENIMNDIDVIYHLAAIPSDWWNKSIFEVNYNGTKNILEKAIKNNVKRIVFMSSLVVHGFANFDGANEETPIIDSKKAGRPYAKSKILCEELLNERKDEIETVIIRPGFTIFGLNDVLTTYDMFKTLEFGTLPFLNHGKARMCYSYVENLVDGLILAGIHENASGETFILSDDKPEYITFYDFIDSISNGLGVKTPTTSLPYWLAYPLVSLFENLCKIFGKKKAPRLTTYRLKVAKFNLSFTCNKAKNLLGYNPKIDFEEALRRSIKWYKEYYNKYQQKG